MRCVNFTNEFFGQFLAQPESIGMTEDEAKSLGTLPQARLDVIVVRIMDASSYLHFVQPQGHA